ncbi:MAG: hypothetical protein AB1757_03175 [Acidobacteriota bacterium]
MDTTREQKLEQVERILQSQALQSSESLKSFLKFIVDKAIDEKEDELKEYTIATEVFGRGKQYNPRTDSVVRVQAGRLRAKLLEYYATEGKFDNLIIELPKGHYKPVFSYVPAPEPANLSASSSLTLAPSVVHHLEASDPAHADSIQSEIATSKNQKRWLMIAAVLIVALLATVAILAFSNLELQKRAEQTAATIPAEVQEGIWSPFLKTDSPTLLVLSNPPVYRFLNAMDPPYLAERAVPLTAEQNKTLTEMLGETFITKNNPTPKLIICPDEFTGVGEAIGLYHVTDLFRKAGRGLSLKQSRTVSSEDLKNHNVIMLGSVWVNEWTVKLPIKEDFVYTNRATIENHNQQPGEEGEYKPQFDNYGRLIEDYALITVKPNISEKDTVMVLAGIHSEGTQAAAEYVAGENYLSALNQRLRTLDTGNEPPRYYQILLKVAVDNGIPTTITPIAIHPLTSERK